ncbi:uncharacterized protein F4812DRAFT_464096 [Daldinia caldariorum]|uniref:uncharacterized protein n=1 Tax=Daldinia caldariorum TaxID=326644 RepID=UPI0020085478|nr:uncharacterized protein F4812DRAFT_464096 [Daldinia caldariorum]KAI1463098.1 hypothetical protein F4812DRAFT_464096 [Daldinia caldariorum]
MKLAYLLSAFLATLAAASPIATISDPAENTELATRTDNALSKLSTTIRKNFEARLYHVAKDTSGKSVLKGAHSGKEGQRPQAPLRFGGVTNKRKHDAIAGNAREWSIWGLAV